MRMSYREPAGRPDVWAEPFTAVTFKIPPKLQLTHRYQNYLKPCPKYLNTSVVSACFSYKC